MTPSPAILIEPGIGAWRRAEIDEQGFPVSFDMVCETDLDRTGAVFMGRVSRIDTGSDLAFFDLGGGIQGVMNHRRARLLKKGRSRSIQECVSQGEVLAVQVVHDPAGLDGKLPSLTPRPKITGRYCVVEAGGARLNFSKDLGPKQVKGLDEALSGLGDKAAIVVRARAARVAPEMVLTEAETAVRMIRGGEQTAPGLIWARDTLDQCLVDLDDSNTPILIEGGSAFARARSLARSRYPDLADRIEGADAPSLMEAYGVEESIEEALAPRIDLPSGGWISVHPTPALTAIDVNMGTAYKAGDAADAKLMVNQEAALAIAWHLRFQNIGGLIVVDFIDLTGKGRIEALMTTLKSALAEDPLMPQTSGLSAFGLVQINRARRGVSLRDRLLVDRAPAERADAAALALLRGAQKLGRTNGQGQLVMTASEAVQTYLKDSILKRLTEETGRMVIVRTGKASVRLEDLP